MAIKKSELYSTLWESCDNLRGSMDASQYKDYVLAMLFIKYISDKYGNGDNPFAEVQVPKGSTFKDMVELKGKPDIGDRINKEIIAPLIDANSNLQKADFPDFNDKVKLGEGKELIDRLNDLIAIFEKPELNFHSNRADDDDLLGDAYEFLMRHFASESGKSKGQFYTPSEVSRILAQVIGISTAQTSTNTTVYDPTCGSGSLLLKVASEAKTGVTLYGQEKDASTSGLARMNMIIHDYTTAQIRQGNTLASPHFKDGEMLKTFDYVVANPPFSDKKWSTGVSAGEKIYKRFEGYGMPPEKNGDYAYLLHILKSLKSTGKGACILPHGVLFRGNAEEEIRRNLIKRGMIKGIIGLPANLFYGTGIPACIIVLDKERANTRDSIFMIDASKGFIKDGNKNRLREMDIHKIVDHFNRELKVPGYSRVVEYCEIEKNEYNLNIPRYIDSSEAEDIQDLEAHLVGGIPQRDIDALSDYWEVFPSLKSSLFYKLRPGYSALKVNADEIRPTIFNHSEFETFTQKMNDVYGGWNATTESHLKGLSTSFHPKELIVTIRESLLTAYTGQPLVDKYDIYQHLMNYWAEVMQDDAYLVSTEGWKADVTRVVEVKKQKGKEDKIVDKGWTCELVPKEQVINRYFAEAKANIDSLTAELESLESEKSELEEEHSGEDGVLSYGTKKSELEAILTEYLVEACKRLDSTLSPFLDDTYFELEIAQDKYKELRSLSLVVACENKKGVVTQKALKTAINSAELEDAAQLTMFLNADTDVKRSLKKLKEAHTQASERVIALLETGADEIEGKEEITILRRYLSILADFKAKKDAIKEATEKLDEELLAFYPTLTEPQIKELVVDDKWLATIDRDVHTELDRLSQRLTQRIKELHERYSDTLVYLSDQIGMLNDKVSKHLKEMGLVW